MADAFGEGVGLGVAEGLADALSLGTGDGGAVPPLRETKALYFAAMRCCGVPLENHCFRCLDGCQRRCSQGDDLAMLRAAWNLSTQAADTAVTVLRCWMRLAHY